MRPMSEGGVDFAGLAELIGAVSAALVGFAGVIWRIAKGRDPNAENHVIPVQGQTVSLPTPQPDQSALVDELRSQIRRLARDSRAHERRGDWWEQLHRRHMATRHADEPEPHYPGDA